MPRTLRFSSPSHCGANETTDRSLFGQLPERSVDLAAEILLQSQVRASSIDRRHQQQVARLIDDPASKRLTLALVDEVLRIKDERRAAGHLNALVQKHGIPQSFPAWDRFLLRAGTWAARLLPRVVMPLIRRRIQRDSSHVILSAEPDSFARYLRRRAGDGVRVNVNQLGEAVLGESEAIRRLESCLDRLADPSVQYLSVKLSAIISKISLTGYDDTVERVKKRLRRLYRAALRTDGPNKFVNLDMEEYRDLHLTVDVFRSVLDESEFQGLSAGIVLQAYLPDSFPVQKSLTRWAMQRVQQGGADIKIRLVKGANLAMEQVEASLHGWPQTPYQTKAESDANYKRMLEYACRVEHASAVRVGVASHNLFDISLALLLTQQRGIRDRVDFEMLEGMANSQLREVSDRTGDLLVYSPICYDADFDAAVAYLVRRFDENTQPGSFLSSLFHLQVDSPEWNQQRNMFLNACELAANPELAATPNRTQNRFTDTYQPSDPEEPFQNAADTDFSLPANREWIRNVVDQAKETTYGTLPIQLAGQEFVTGDQELGRDPSRPGKTLYTFSYGNRGQVDHGLKSAVAAQPDWEAIGIEARAKVLRQYATVCARRRGETIGVMMADAGKSAMEADTEISEAIDFAEYYSRSLDDAGWDDGTTSEPAGVVVITPPWNFPYAIPAGGCLAALMAGNSVILKPAPETVLTAWHLACQLWDAGVPRDVLQFLPVPDNDIGKSLICDPRVDIVVLTGAFATAQLFQSWRPDLRLCAETSGKNSLIITSTADLDLAVKDLVKGAFGHAGQKCSATSLALVQRDLYESQRFRNQLRDAAASLCVSSSWNLSADVTPVIREPHAELKRGLTQLDEGESWLLEPRMVDGNPCLWSPGIRLGVQPGSWYHRTECFGPVLGIISFDSLKEAIEIQNDSEFGLTGGIHSLDPEEIAQWRESVEVGNAYINRSTTGAIVQRQPFGGWKYSAVGPGAKAGGPNYVASFRRWSQAAPAELTKTLTDDVRSFVSRLSQLLPANEERKRFENAASSYLYWWENHFSCEHDPSRLHGEDNRFRYHPQRWVSVLLTDHAADLSSLQQTVLLCRIAGIPMSVSAEQLPDWSAEFTQMTEIEIQQSSVKDFCENVPQSKFGTIRVYCAQPPRSLRKLKQAGIRLATGSCLANGRLEWLCVLREQSLTETTHRHGNLQRP